MYVCACACDRGEVCKFVCLNVCYGAWKIVIISVNIVCVGLHGDSGSVPCKCLCDVHYPYVERYISIYMLYDMFIGGN